MSLTKAHNRMIAGASVNVLDFGAVGDGSTDDSAAFQAAATSLGNTGGQIFVPFGTYVISNLSLRSYTHLCCEHGTVLAPAQNNLPVLKIDASGSTTLADTSNPDLVRNRIKISGCIIDNRVSSKTVKCFGFPSYKFVEV